jgi:hypothetical protein
MVRADEDCGMAARMDHWIGQAGNGNEITELESAFFLHAGILSRGAA